MSETVFIRDLPARQNSSPGAEKTGDRLQDGSVLLLARDMDRMGLSNLRMWLDLHAIQERAVISIVDENPAVRARPMEEFAV